MSLPKLVTSTTSRLDPLDELEQDPDVRAAIADVEELRRKEAEVRQQTRFERFRDTLLEWGHDSSYDGIPSLVRAHNNKVRAFWALCVLASLALFFYLIFITLQDYLQFGTNIQLELNNAQFEFPTVTICNASPYKLSAVRQRSAGLRALVDLYNRLVREGRIKNG